MIASLDAARAWAVIVRAAVGSGTVMATAFAVPTLARVNTSVLVASPMIVSIPIASAARARAGFHSMSTKGVFSFRRCAATAWPAGPKPTRTTCAERRGLTPSVSPVAGACLSMNRAKRGARATKYGVTKSVATMTETMSSKSSVPINWVCRAMSRRTKENSPICARHRPVAALAPAVNRNNRPIDQDDDGLAEHDPRGKCAHGDPVLEH